jgi:membrane associated rhomboid family serine protease
MDKKVSWKCDFTSQIQGLINMNNLYSSEDAKMSKLRDIPFVTLSIALVITIIQVSRPNGSYDDPFMANLNVNSWEILYNQPWRILTSPFLHHNYLHFLQNLVFLLLFGWQIEKKFGKGILLGVFFGAMVASYVIWINLMHNWLIGISGGVCGLFGFSLIGNRRSPWWTTLTHRPLHILYSANLLFAVIIDYMDWVPFPIAHLAHVVGILYGIAFGIAFQLTTSKALWRAVVISLPILLFASQIYSPWQVEWRLVRNQPILLTGDANCHLKSLAQEKFTPAKVNFMNSSAEARAVYWLDYEGQAKFQFWLGPGGSKEYNSFVGHPWCIVALESNMALQAVSVTETEQIITIP